MVKLSTVNELTLKVTFDNTGDSIHTKMGSMICMQGQNGAKPITFTKEILGPSNGRGIGGAVVGQLARRITGENMPLMHAVSNGYAEGYFAHQGNHVVVLDLSQGEKIYVESENLLAFTEDCKYGVEFFGMGIISQGGLCKSTLTGMGPNAQVAVICEGNPIVLKGQCVVDPDAYICSIGQQPGFGLDINFRNLIGQSSGESYNMQFKDPNNIVIIQPFERESGVNIGMDGGSSGQRGSRQQNQTFQQAGQSVSDTIGGLSNMLGGLFG